MFFWYVKVPIFGKCIHYTIHWHKTQILKKIIFGQNKWYNKCLLFFFRVLQLVTDLLLICDSYMSWSTRFVSLKLCVEFSIFDSVPFLFYVSLNFCSRKCINSLTLQCQNVNWNNRNATHGFAPKRLIFKLQQEVLKFSYVCGNWSS